MAGGPPPQKSPIPSRHTRCIPLTADVSVVLVFGKNSQGFSPTFLALSSAPECREVPCVGCSAIGVSVGDSQHDSLSESVTQPTHESSHFLSSEGGSDR